MVHASCSKMRRITKLFYFSGLYGPVHHASCGTMNASRSESYRISVFMVGGKPFIVPLSAS